VSLLEVRDVAVEIGGRRVVDDVSFELPAAGRLGIVGASGSGKTLTALAVLGLAPAAARVSGSVRLDGAELVGRGDRELSRLRGDRLAMVFQEPLTALNPVHRVGRQIAEPLRLHRGLGRRAAAAAAVEWCARVGLPDPERTARAYPHQLSGGQRQRVGIAIAVACAPALLVADEPTTALDVTVQAGIVDLLRDLVAEHDTALLFISHDLALVGEVCDRMLVMNDGRVVEQGPAGGLLTEPAHPYTRALVTAAAAGALPEVPR
jgi:peptide/nickel transport system ATP-binding protein